MSRTPGPPPPGRPGTSWGSLSGARGVSRRDEPASRSSNPPYSLGVVGRTIVSTIKRGTHEQALLDLGGRGVSNNNGPWVHRARPAARPGLRPTLEPFPLPRRSATALSLHTR